MVDVSAIRAAAAARAAGRPAVAFPGRVEDDTQIEPPVRRYVPDQVELPATVLFAHGGYGLFGTLDLQDAYCRRLATGLQCSVTAVDYRLAPEHSFTDAVDDLIATALRVAGPVILCGDSAGGAVATAAATCLEDVRALLLTNPNLDLTLRSFDKEVAEGPDWELSVFAFSAWTRAARLHEAPRLDQPSVRLPPAFVAVGEHDALVPEASALTRACRALNTASELIVIPNAGHGFMGDAGLATTTIQAMRDFVVAHG